tara:strand:- start:140 stop:328 length:189 start_codon:yes stop_codon:yes gene_type:complete
LGKLIQVMLVLLFIIPATAIVTLCIVSPDALAFRARHIKGRNSKAQMRVFMARSLPQMAMQR